MIEKILAHLTTNIITIRIGSYELSLHKIVKEVKTISELSDVLESMEKKGGR